jgi:hypothetical protein
VSFSQGVSADPKRTYGREWRRRTRKVASSNKVDSDLDPPDNGDVEMRPATSADLEIEEGDNDYFDDIVAEIEDNPEDIEEQLEERYEAILRIVSSLVQHKESSL